MFSKIFIQLATFNPFLVMIVIHSVYNHFNIFDSKDCLTLSNEFIFFLSPNIQHTYTEITPAWNPYNGGKLQIEVYVSYFLPGRFSCLFVLCCCFLFVVFVYFRTMIYSPQKPVSFFPHTLWRWLAGGRDVFQPSPPPLPCGYLWEARSGEWESERKHPSPFGFIHRELRAGARIKR